MVVKVLLKKSIPKVFNINCTNKSGGVAGVCIPHRVGKIFLDIYPIRRGDYYKQIRAIWVIGSNMISQSLYTILKRVYLYFENMKSKIERKQVRAVYGSGTRTWERYSLYLLLCQMLLVKYRFLKKYKRKK